MKHILPVMFGLSACSLDINLEPRELYDAERAELSLAKEASQLGIDHLKGKIGSKAMRVSSEVDLDTIKGASPVDPDAYVPVSAYYNEKEGVVMYALDSNPDREEAYTQKCDFHLVPNVDDLVRREIFLSRTGLVTDHYGFCPQKIETVSGVLAHEFGHKITGEDHSKEHYKLVKALKKATDNEDYDEVDRITKELAKLDEKKTDWVQKIGLRTDRAVGRALTSLEDELRLSSLVDDSECSGDDTKDEVYGEIGDRADAIEDFVADRCRFYYELMGFDEYAECNRHAHDLRGEIRRALFDYYAPLIESNETACIANFEADDWGSIRHTFSDDLVEEFDELFAEQAYMEIPPVSTCINDDLDPLAYDTWTVENIVNCDGGE